MPVRLSSAGSTIPISIGVLLSVARQPTRASLAYLPTPLPHELLDTYFVVTPLLHDIAHCGALEKLKSSQPVFKVCTCFKELFCPSESRAYWKAVQ
ncbi:hypothetical protein BDQ12DRAFT_690512 [Crucibulum laeve]|uniref:Uncharacterized protein n=1 Tax=Crucibulum laeve TaxID=68775 RepID=A0A5C3LL52_9AGAR|nr:hypothetical protein BDQ12DRAFT_690512 [Crucibulum laeve]